MAGWVFQGPTVDRTCEESHQPPPYQTHPFHKQTQCHRLPVGRAQVLMRQENRSEMDKKICKYG